MSESYAFWDTLAGLGPRGYNDLAYRVLQFNGYSGSLADMYADWRDDGKPTLSAIILE